MRGETNRTLETRPDCPISIHSPHARGDTDCFISRDSCNISIHSPHARGDEKTDETKPGVTISIHSPHARGDGHDIAADRSRNGFQSTPLMRGETMSLILDASVKNISIHSPHARGDGLRAWLFSGSCHFNPLPSCEGRLIDDLIAEHERRFQSTPLMRGETNNGLCDGFYAIFQSTPLMRGETVSSGSVTSAGIFQSTPLMRGETNAFMIRS